MNNQIVPPGKYFSTVNKKGCQWNKVWNWILVLLLLPTGARAIVVTDHLPVGKLIDARELEEVLNPARKGRLFTMSVCPKLDIEGVHSFLIPNTTTTVDIRFKSSEVKLEVGSAYVVTDVRQIIHFQDESKFVTLMLKLHRIKNGQVSDKDDDRVLCRVRYNVTGREVYDEDLFITALGIYFDSVAQELREGREYSGKSELEGSRESIQAMINWIGLVWDIEWRKYKGLIMKEKAKDAADADFYVMKFATPIPAERGKKLKLNNAVRGAVPADSGEKLGDPYAGNNASKRFFKSAPIVIDAQSVSISGVFSYFEVRVINPK